MTNNFQVLSSNLNIFVRSVKIEKYEINYINASHNIS